MSESPLKVALVALNRPGYQSLALGYLRAYAQQNEHLQDRVAFQTLDLTTEAEPWWAAFRILRMQPDVVAFSVSCWNADPTYEVCSIIKRSRPQMLTVVGGPEVSPIAEGILKANPSIDVVVRGEGEVTFAELLRAVATDAPAWECEGVTAWEGERIVSAPDRPLIEDLDVLPSPYVAGLLQPSESLSYVETYRGCPHRCAYCYEGKGTARVRSFSRERIKSELDAVATTPGIRAISFVDSVFNLTPDRLSWLADLLEPYAKRGLHLHTIEVDMERIDVSAASELVRAGVVSVETGPQTVGFQALGACHRPFNADRFAHGVSALRAVGIRVECDLIFGLPGDDPFDIIRGLRWLLSLDPGILQSSTLRVLPGTELWTRSGDMGLEYEPHREHAVIQTPGIDFTDLRRLEVMAAALQEAYRARSDEYATLSIGTL
jgi:radical SAM superfamily enzyme YgiQ (UPF0313 family)